MPDPELVRYRADGAVATVTLDSPANRNALSGALLTQLVQALDRAGEDPAVRVIVLTGAGPAFCSGADLAEQRTVNETGQATAAGFPLPDVLRRLWRSPKPVLGRVNGPARAGGIGLVAACDVAVASDSATFAFPEVRVGVVPALVSVVCLPRMQPRSAVEHLLTGEPFDARRAVEIGLVNRAVAAAELDAEVARYAGMLLRGGPEALAHTKAVTREVPGLDFDAALERMLALSRDRFASAEAREGMRAFAERRPPSWAPDGPQTARPGPAGPAVRG
jgi:methylglutaconyl-CoA hydratase